MKYPKTSSLIAKAVHDDAKKHVDFDAQPGMNTCRGVPKCGNAEALEDLFVAATAHWFADKLNLPFHEVIYAPNRIVERRCGFDLSVGQFNSKKIRIRIQSKIVPTWCDVKNSIRLDARQHDGTPKTQWTSANRLHRQAELLGSICAESKQRAFPYLMVHQCFCLHEYRRMGRSLGTVEVPRLEAGLRTLAVDLSDPTFIQHATQDETWALWIDTDPAAKSATCKVILSDNSEIPLEVRDLQFLLDQIIK